MAEKEGFEPSIPLWGIHDFQSCALGRTTRLLHVRSNSFDSEIVSLNIIINIPDKVKPQSATFQNFARDDAGPRAQVPQAPAPISEPGLARLSQRGGDQGAQSCGMCGLCFRQFRVKRGQFRGFRSLCGAAVALRIGKLAEICLAQITEHAPVHRARPAGRARVADLQKILHLQPAQMRPLGSRQPVQRPRGAAGARRQRGIERRRLCRTLDEAPQRFRARTLGQWGQ